MQDAKLLPENGLQFLDGSYAQQLFNPQSLLMG